MPNFNLILTHVSRRQNILFASQIYNPAPQYVLIWFVRDEKKYNCPYLQIEFIQHFKEKLKLITGAITPCILFNDQLK